VSIATWSGERWPGWRNRLPSSQSNQLRTQSDRLLVVNDTLYIRIIHTHRRHYDTHRAITSNLEAPRPANSEAACSVARRGRYRLAGGRRRAAGDRVGRSIGDDPGGRCPSAGGRRHDHASSRALRRRPSPSSGKSVNSPRQRWRVDGGSAALDRERFAQRPLRKRTWRTRLVVHEALRTCHRANQCPVSGVK
jgi:hypothetical protein